MGLMDTMGATGSQANALGNTRALRGEFLMQGHVASVTDILAEIEHEYLRRNENPEAGRNRERAVRFAELFENGQILPPPVFIAMLRLEERVKVNGTTMEYHPEVMQLRDNCVRVYKPLLAKVRQLMAKEIFQLPAQLVQDFVDAWLNWEDKWLEEMETHAVAALQPLANAILSLEPLVKSIKKQELLAFPRIISQRAVTVKYLDGYLKSLGQLSAATLSSVQREANADPNLLVLMEYLIAQECPEDEQKRFFLKGLSDAPDIKFQTTGETMSLEAYAFRIRSCAKTTANMVNLAKSLMHAFDEVKDHLQEVRQYLDVCSPDLEQDETLKFKLNNFENAYKKAKRRALEPDNLV